MSNRVKLVRDGIIEEIRRKGEYAICWQATEAELRILSIQKLIEEAKELLKAVEESEGRDRILEEAGDVQETFELFLKTHRISSDEVMHAQIRKRRKNRGFDGGWVLDES